MLGAVRGRGRRLRRAPQRRRVRLQPRGRRRRRGAGHRGGRARRRPARLDAAPALARAGAGAARAGVRARRRWCSAPDGARLAKRHGDVTLREVAAGDAVAWMAASLGLPPAATARELLAAFDPAARRRPSRRRSPASSRPVRPRSRPGRPPRARRAACSRGVNGVAIARRRPRSARRAEARERGERAVAGLGEREAGVAHQRVDLVGERGADDRLAVAGAGDRGGRVVGPGPGRRSAASRRRGRGACRSCRRWRSPRRRRRVRRARPRRPCRRGVVARRERAPAVLGVKPRLGRGAPVPPSRANSCAASPTSITWRPSSSTARAAATGLRMPRSAATAPAARSVPRMIEASRPTPPSLVQRRAAAGVEDRVVLEHDTAAWTAASALPPPGEHGMPGLDRRARRRTPSGAPARRVGRPLPGASMYDDRHLRHRRGTIAAASGH